MGVLRINAKTDLLLLGASIAAGNSAQNDPALRNAGFRLAEIHAHLRLTRIELLGQGAMLQLDDSEAISVYNATNMPSMATGNMVQAGFNVLEGSDQLWIFVRQTNSNLNARMPNGFVADPSLDKKSTLFGASYSPRPNVVIKSDFAFKQNALSKRSDEFSLGVGVVF